MAETNETTEALIAEYRADADKMDAHELPQPTTQYLRIMLDRFDAAHKREHEALEFIAHYDDDIYQMDDPCCADGHILASKAKEALGIKED